MTHRERYVLSIYMRVCVEREREREDRAQPSACVLRLARRRADDSPRVKSNCAGMRVYVRADRLLY